MTFETKPEPGNYSDSHTDVTVDSDRDLSVSSSMLRKSSRNSTATTTRSSSYLSPEEIRALSEMQREFRSILVVRTQAESLRQSLDSQLENSQRRATVSFGQLHIREFAYRPGDNPGGRAGVALTIEWEVQDELCCDLEAYEESRPPRRERSELNIPPDMRLQMLKQSGYSRAEIMEYTRIVNIARGQRQRTQETLQLATAQEFCSKVFRGVLNKTVRISKKKKERKLIRMSIIKDQQLQVLRNQLVPESPRWQSKQDTGCLLLAAKEEAPSTPTDDLSDSSYENDRIDEEEALDNKTNIDEPWVDDVAPVQEAVAEC